MATPRRSRSSCSSRGWGAEDPPLPAPPRRQAALALRGAGRAAGGQAGALFCPPASAAAARLRAPPVGNGRAGAAGPAGEATPPPGGARSPLHRPCHPPHTHPPPLHEQPPTPHHPTTPRTNRKHAGVCFAARRGQMNSGRSTCCCCCLLPLNAGRQTAA